MRKFLKTGHVISRVFLILCIVAVLLLYFFKPGIMEIAKGFLPGVNNGSWLAVVTALAVAAVMFAASELAYKSLTDSEFMVTLSSAVLKPAYDAFDLSDKRYSKVESGEKEFNAGLRDITDGKERVLRELAWEKQHCRKLQKKKVGNTAVSVVFFIAGLLFFLYPLVIYLVSGRLMELPVGTAADFVSIGALILAVVIILECGSNQGYQRRLNTILSIRSRGEEYMKSPAPAAALPNTIPAPAEYVPAPVKPPVQAEAKPEVTAKPEAKETAAAAPAPAEENWKPEPQWTGVPEEQVMEVPHESPFVIMKPEEAQEAAPTPEE